MFTKLAENHIAFFFFLYLISTFLFCFIFQKLFHFKKQLCPMCKLGTPFQSKLNWPSDLWRNLLSIIFKNPLKINNTFIIIIKKKKGPLWTKATLSLSLLNFHLSISHHPRKHIPFLFLTFLSLFFNQNQKTTNIIINLPTHYLTKQFKLSSTFFSKL